MTKQREASPVIIKVPEGDEKKAENLRVYLVDKQGKLIESHSLKSGEARLETAAAKIHGKVYIAPALSPELHRVNINEKTLQNMGAWQPSFRLSGDNVLRLPNLPHLQWPLPFGWCHVTGSVTKTFNVNGVPEVLPVCDAIVHICEVERIWFVINKIPEPVLNDLRGRLAKLIQIPIPGPVGPDPGPELRFNAASFSRQASVLPEMMSLKGELPERPEFPAHVKNAILSGPVAGFRNIIANNFNLFHPYLCWWPWFWPWFYDCDEVATVTTGCNGRFDCNLLYFLNNHPNVYIWIEQTINGSLKTIYNPWISCHTYWNYSCGTDININITDPDVLPCFCDTPTIEPEYVWIKNVNFGRSIRGIQQSETASGHLANAVGLTSYGAYGNISPFGSSFPLVVQFGDGLSALGVTHYRWSYARQKDAYLTTVGDTNHIIGGNVAKPFSRWIEITPSDWEHLPGSFALGPIIDSHGKTMYKIPHSDASVDSGLAGAMWDTGDDTASVNIGTSGWDPGLYKFTIELLNNNGDVVPLTTNPFKVSRLPSDPPPPVAGVDTIDANGLSENYLIKDGSGKTIGFSFLMRIDNNYCYAGISDAIVAGGTTDTECGTGYYNDKNTDNVQIIFQAGHPHNFATYDFKVYKGNSGSLAVAASSGTSANANDALVVNAGNNLYAISQVDIPVPVPPLPANPVNPVSNMDQYQKAILVKDMLGTCTMAAFSENVNVYATHTDGNTRIAYDAGYVAAIAIAPHS